jgi:hypothetical protein
VDGLTRDPTGMYELAIRRATANGFANETVRDRGDDARQPRRSPRPFASSARRDGTLEMLGDARRMAHNPESRVQIPPPLLVCAGQGPFLAGKGPFATGNVAKVGAGAVCRDRTGETGWHAARQRGTR